MPHRSRLAIGDVVITPDGCEGVVVDLSPGCATILEEEEYESYDPKDLIPTH